MKTYSARESDIQRRWLVVDAEDDVIDPRSVVLNG